MCLTNDEKRELLDLAKKTIIDTARNISLQKYECRSKRLKEPGAAFVTIEKKGKLRGCIGHMEAVAPLDETIRDMAVSASKHDPRFPSVTENELKDLTIEISVLTPLKLIDSIEEIEVGKHGIWIESGYNKGVLLPQVAVEYGWDRETFLEHTSMKAGMSQDGWKHEDTVIKIFSAEIFGNEKVLDE